MNQSMSVASQIATENAVIIGAIAVALIAAWALWMYTRRTRPGSRRDYPQYRPQRTPGPMPGPGETRANDYERALAHIPCQATACSHKPWPGPHCRVCDLPYPCPVSGPINQRRSGFDDDARAYQRSWRETGRWDV